MTTVLLLATMALCALIVAVGAAWLARTDGMTIQKTIMCGGGAFAGTLTLLLFVRNSCSPALVPGLLTGMAGLVSSITAVGAAWLARSDGMTVQRAILFGGGVFGGAMTLLVVALEVCGPLAGGTP